VPERVSGEFTAEDAEERREKQRGRCDLKEMDRIALEWLEQGDNRDMCALRAYVREMICVRDGQIKSLRADLEQLNAVYGNVYEGEDSLKAENELLKVRVADLQRVLNIEKRKLERTRGSVNAEYAECEEVKCYFPGGVCRHQEAPFFRMRLDDGQEFVFCARCIGSYLLAFPDVHYDITRLPQLEKKGAKDANSDVDRRV